MQKNGVEMHQAKIQAQQAEIKLVELIELDLQQVRRCLLMVVDHWVLARCEKTGKRFLGIHSVALPSNKECLICFSVNEKCNM